MPDECLKQNTLSKEDALKKLKSSQHQDLRTILLCICVCICVCVCVWGGGGGEGGPFSPSSSLTKHTHMNSSWS